MSALEIHQTIAFQDYLKREMKRLRFSTGLLSRRVGSLTCATCNIWDDAIARCVFAIKAKYAVDSVSMSGHPIRTLATLAGIPTESKVL